MDGRNDTEKGVVFIDLPLIMRTECGLSALNSRPAMVRAVMHHESKVWTPETVDDVRLRSSIKHVVSAVLLVVNLGTLGWIEYSSIMFIPAKERSIERVQPAKIPH